MKLAFGIENIRRISSTPHIEMRPITILVGRNSAGKSTFLRSLPLIRQSLETRSSAPVLWFGDLVDFGDPNVAIGESETSRLAAFCFTLSDVRGETRRSRYYYYPGPYFMPRQLVRVNSVSVRYVIGVQGERTVLKTIQVKISDENIDVGFNLGAPDGVRGQILIDGEPIDILPTYNLEKAGWNLFSPPVFTPRSSKKEGRGRRWPMQAADILAEALVDAFRIEVTRNLSDKTYGREAWRILSEEHLDSDTLKKLTTASTTVSFRELYRKLARNRKSKLGQKVLSIHKLSRVLAVLEVVEEQLTEYFSNVGYLEPVRAASERFYRKQELEVSEIAPNGANFPMFLASLGEGGLSRFSNWVEEIFGYGVGLHTTGGHISMLLQSGKTSVNVTDTGYGVSQILPVLGIIWWAQSAPTLSRTRRKPGTGIRTLVIEQPELHLHPAHQAKLADVFVSVIGKGQQRDASKLETRLVVETHSEALIQRLGELVEERKVDPEAIQIVIFSANEDLDSPTKVSLSRFDDTGALSNWPFGFFNYSDK